MDITKRKKEILQCLAQGKRTEEIAEELNLAVGTVNLHIRELKLMLRANTLPEMLYKVSKTGVI